MKFCIVIPAHNEEAFLGSTLASLTGQTLIPKKIIVVNDHSTDTTEKIIDDFSSRYSYISKVNTQSESKHLPGSKVVNAFNSGYASLNTEYDVICKFDADLIFPHNYLATLKNHFSNSDVGMAGGFCYIESNGIWVLENLTNEDHIRGGIKAYRKECFEAIGGLKPSMGWDTVDELLARYHNWKIVTDRSLQVKHLKPTGATYNKKAKYKQGEAFYKLRYGFLITLIASLKLTARKKNPQLFLDYLKGYFKAKKEKQPYLVSSKEGAFIRKYRWHGIWSKIF